MSRTDKDRPWWVASHQDGYGIDHDHRHGACIEETVEYARGNSGGSWGKWSHNHRECKKSQSETTFCEKHDAEPGCWTWRCRCSTYRWRRHSAIQRFHGECPTWGRVQCDGHIRRWRDDSIPCVCDDWPPVPTCDLVYHPVFRRRYYSGGVPSEFVREHFTAPERRRERDALTDMRREYNAHGDLEDGDFVSNQNRNAAYWYYW